jgi:hypothetical protein
MDKRNTRINRRDFDKMTLEEQVECGLLINTRGFPHDLYEENKHKKFNWFDTIHKNETSSD